MLSNPAKCHSNTSRTPHYENLPMRRKENFFSRKNGKFHRNFFHIFLIFAQNMNCGGHMLELPRRDGSNEYLLHGNVILMLEWC